MNPNLFRSAALISLMLVAALLAGCAASVKQSTPTDDKPANDHAKMHDMPAAPPQANVDATGQKEIEITIENFAYVPADVTIAPGTKVTWINKDEAPHTATSSDKKFNSGGLDTDDKFSFVFNEKGDFPYICTLHPQMKATIKVK